MCNTGQENLKSVYKGQRSFTKKPHLSTTKKDITGQLTNAHLNLIVLQITLWELISIQEPSANPYLILARASTKTVPGTRRGLYYH